MHTSKVVRIVMIAMIVLPLLSGLASSNTPVASASTGFSWNVTRNDFVGDCSQGPWFVNRSTLNFGGHVENNATFTAKVRSAAYHSDTAGCAPTTDAPAPFSFSGSGLYAPGDSGDFMFSFNPASYNCGRVQLDGLFIDNTTHEAIDGIYGVILNYGVNCNGSQPTPTPSQNPTPTPAPTRTPTPNPTPLITPQPGNLSAVCVAGPAVQLAWGNGVNQNSNSLQRMIGTTASGGSWAFIYQDPTLNVRSYTDHNVSANTTYSYRIKYGANVASNVVTVNCSGSTPTPTPVPTTPTPTPGQTSAGTLTGLCVSGKVVLNWTSGVNANSNGLEKGDSFPNDPNQFWAFVQPQPGFNDRSYTDANITPGVAYSYRVKYAPGVPSNIVTVTCPIPATPTPSPTPLSSVSPAPTPTPTPGQCIMGTVVVNSNNVSAPYTVIGPNGAVTVTGNNTFTNQATGNYSISINGNNNVVVAPTTNILACNSTIIFNIIVNGTPTPVPSLTPNPSPNTLAISKLGKDLTEGQTTEQVSLNVRRSDTLEFDIHVRAGNTSATNVIVSDRLPAGIIYLSHTSALNGIAVNDGVANGGINIGTLSAGQEAVVSFRALVDISAFPAGVTRIFNSADIRADNIPTMTVQLPIELSSIGIISQVKTGPTDTLWMAMAVSALATLVYFRYTGTVLFKRREVLALVREQSKDRSRLNFANVR